MTFHIVGAIRETPDSSRFGYLLDRSAGPAGLGAFVRAAPGDGVLRGAVVRDGPDTRTVALLRTPGGGGSGFVLTCGRCTEVDVRPLAWLAELGLDVNYIDVSAAARGLAGDPAFFLYRRAPGRPIIARAVPRPPLRGPSRSRGDRPDVVAALRTQLLADHPAGGGAVDRAQLSAAVRAATLPGRPARSSPTAHPPVILARLRPRTTRPASRGLPTRYDTVLGWLSELEDGVSSTQRFRETWRWLCERDGQPADADRAALVLYHLEVLGHVEQDRGQRQVGVAPAVANVLTGGAGYALLCGARPPRLMQRLSETEIDHDRRVREAGQHWDVHRRGQRTAADEPVGPSAVYLEWDPDRHELVVEGLQALGVQVTVGSGDCLLDLLVPLARAVDTALELTMAPSAHFDRWEPGTGGSQWVPRTSDRGTGLYRYTSWGGPVFAWREQSGAPLRVVDKRVGLYLQHAHDQRTALLHHDPFESRLVVPRSAPLPPLTARALVLRTGLLPWLLPGFRRDGTGAPGDVLVYRNVDHDTGQRVAELLGQTLTTLTHRLEDCR